MKNYKFQLSVAALICFWHASGLTFLLSLNYLFTRDYYVSTWVEIFTIRDEIFHIIAIFSYSVYRVEISTRDETLHIISPKLALRDWSTSRKVSDLGRI